MAYEIQYSPETVTRYRNHAEKHKSRVGGWITVLLLAAAALSVRYNGIPDFLIPGDPAVTKQAARTFLELLQEGEPVMDAVTVFCNEILDGAQM